VDLTLFGLSVVVLFLIPGYLFNCGRRKVVIRQDLSEVEFFTQAICASLALYPVLALVWWVLGLFGSLKLHAVAVAKWAKDGPLPSLDDFWFLGWTLAFLLLLAPVAGLLFGWVQSKSPLDRVLRNLPIPIRNAHFSEWDHLFIMQPVWIQINAKDGTTYRGKWVGVTSHPDKHEILLKDVSYWKAGAGEKDEETLSPYTHLWISGDEVASLYAMLPTPPTSVASAGAEAAQVQKGEVASGADRAGG
jgi:hypothetical protein